jgi:hypothetical protein
MDAITRELGPAPAPEWAPVVPEDPAAGTGFAELLRAAGLDADEAPAPAEAADAPAPDDGCEPQPADLQGAARADVSVPLHALQAPSIAAWIVPFVESRATVAPGGGDAEPTSGEIGDDTAADLRTASWPLAREYATTGQAPPDVSIRESHSGAAPMPQAGAPGTQPLTAAETRGSEPQLDVVALPVGDGPAPDARNPSAPAARDAALTPAPERAASPEPPRSAAARALAAAIGRVQGEEAGPAVSPGPVPMPPPSRSGPVRGDVRAQVEPDAAPQAVSPAASVSPPGSGGSGNQQLGAGVETYAAPAPAAPPRASAPPLETPQPAAGASTPAPAAAPGGAPRASAPVPVPDDAAEPILQLASALRVFVRDGVTEARVRLRPEHLGDVQIAIRVDRDRVSAVLQVERADVRGAIEAQSQSLRSQLAAQGLHLAELTVREDGRGSHQHGRDQAEPERRRAPKEPERPFTLPD